jgi:hypothetical protein
MHIGYWWECRKEAAHWEDQDMHGWTILKWTLERYECYYVHITLIMNYSMSEEQQI